MKIIIESCSNGAFVILDDGENTSRVVYRFDEEDISGLQYMLCDIADQFIPGSRHDKMRIHVDIKHGDKYTCAGCDICDIKG